MLRRQFLRNGLAAVMAPAVHARPAAAQAKRTVRIGTVSPLNAFDPVRFSEAFIMRAVFPPITRITAQTGDPLAGWEPYAATPSKPSWQSGPGHIEIKATPERAWRGGAHNTAADIVRGIERAQRHLTARDSILRNITKLVVHDDAVCRAYLQAPDTRIYKEAFSRSWTTPLTRATHDALEDPQTLRLTDRSFGTLGPYLFDEPFRPGERVTLNANVAWARKSPGIETFSIYAIPSVKQAAELFDAGEIDLAFLPSDRVLAAPSLRATDFQTLAVVTTQALSSVTYLAIETGDGATSDQRTREAVRAAIDPVKIAEAAYGGGAQPTSDVIPAGFLAERSAANRWYDPRRARQWLAEAGRPDGFTARLLVADEASERRAAEEIVNQLQQVGIKLQSEVVSWAVIFSRRDRDPRTPTFVLARTPVAQSPVHVLANFISNAPGNFLRFANAEFDKSVELLATQAEGWQQALRLARSILDSAAVLIPIAQPISYLLTRRGLRAAFAPDGTLGDLTDIAWE